MGTRSRLVFFDGPWSDQEREKIMESAERIQEERPISYEPKRGYLWVCSMQRTAYRTLFAAHVQADAAVLSASSVDELTEKMYERAGVGKDRDRGFEPQA